MADEEYAELVLLFQQQQNLESVEWCGWVDASDAKKKGASERRLCVVGPNRIWLLKAAKKKVEIAVDIHYLNITHLSSSSGEELTITTKQAATTIKSNRADDIIHGIRQKTFGENFPAADEAVFWKNEVPPNRLKDIEKVDRPCGNYRNAYVAICDHQGVSPHKDIMWDIDHVFSANNIKAFNLNEFDGPLTAADTKALIGALKWNNYFTALQMKGFKLDKDEIAAVASCLATNKKIEELNLAAITTGGKDSLVELCTQLSANRDCAVTTLNFANVPLLDAAMVPLSNWIGSLTHGLSTINIANCGSKGKGMAAFGNALKKNVYMAQSLANLNISGNKLEGEGSTALAAFLAMPNTVTRLLLPDCAANMDVLMGALNRGSCHELRELDISSNKINGKGSVTHLTVFIKGSSTLNKLNLANIGFPADSVRDVIMAIYSNVYIKNAELSLAKNPLGLIGARAIMSVAAEISNVEKLDVSECDLDDEAIGIIAEGLCHCPGLKLLNISRNLTPKADRKQRHQSIEALINLLNSECQIESLIVQGGRGAQIGADLVGLIDAIGSDEKLKHLDISNQAMGNKCAVALFKALQTNHTLSSLAWDENGTTLQGFRLFRNGLRRNNTLKTAPTPFLDFDACYSKEQDKEALVKTVREIEDLVCKNNAPKAKFKKTDGNKNQFLFFSTAQREELEKLVLKIKTTGGKPSMDDVNIMKDSENFETTVGTLHGAKADALQVLEDKLNDKLREQVAGIETVIGEGLKGLKTTLMKTIEDNYRSLDKDTLRRIGTNLNFGTQEVDTKAIQDVLVSAAGAELLAKAVESYTSAVDIAADYTFEKIADSLEAIIDRLQGEQSEAKRATDSSASASTASESEGDDKKKPKETKDTKGKDKKDTKDKPELAVPPKKPSAPPPEPPSKKGLAIKLGGGPPSPIGRLFGSKKRDDDEAGAGDDLPLKSPSSGNLFAPSSSRRDDKKDDKKDKDKAKEKDKKAKSKPSKPSGPPAPAGALDEMEKKTAGPLADPRANRARIAARRRPPTRRPREEADD